MKLFNTLALEITAQCNRRCAFCPVAYNTRPDERMEPALLQKALRELGAMRYRGRIELYIYNEPCKDMAYLKEALGMARLLVPGACLMVATNGDYLKGVGSICELLDAGLNQLLINCYSPGLYQRRLPWMQGLPMGISQKRSVYATLGPRTQTVQMLDKSNPQQFGTGIFRLINRAGNITEFLPATPQPVERMCVKPFRLMNINWTGQALLCCNDYHGALDFGNLQESTLVELWKHPVLMTYRRTLLQRKRTLPLCSKCDCHAGAYPGNVPQPHGPFATKQKILGSYKEAL